MSANYDRQHLLDAIGHGILVFADDGALVLHNSVAGKILGTDLNVIKTKGWRIAEELFNVNIADPEDYMVKVKARAFASEHPVRFHIFRSGQYVPCWASALPQPNGKFALLLTIDVPDWSIVTHLIDRFRDEMRDAVDSTLGHINIINHSINPAEHDDEATAKVARRIGGFTRLITIHMQRASRLMGMLQRLEDIRTGTLQTKVREARRKIDLEDLLEDFIESLDEIDLLDPETEVEDYRTRIKLEINERLYVDGMRTFITATLQELVRNAIMYSLRGTPVLIKAHTRQDVVLIDVIDEGYGIRQKSQDRVFNAFERGHQPQIISEFGYGLALYLCRQEIEAMNGRLWFKTEEGVGTVFTIQLNQWRASSAEDAVC